MSDRLLELQSILSNVRRRWTLRASLRAWVLGAVAAATVLLAGLGAILLVAREGFPLVITVSFVTACALFAIGRALWPLRRRPTDRQLARFIEEHSPVLDDIVVTAVDYAARPDGSAGLRDLLAEDAVRAVRDIQLEPIVSRASIRQAVLRAAGATAMLALAVALLSPSYGRATSLAGAYLFPARVAVEVTPGSLKVRAGAPLTITARVRGVEGGFTPVLTVSVGDQIRQVKMLPADQAGEFAVALKSVTAAFQYNVAAAGVRSADYTVTVVHPPRVERIDVRYEFPRGLGLEPRTDEDSGDIYGPAGTKVHLTITADKPIDNAALTLDDGSKIPLSARDQTLVGELTIEDDGSYRVALADRDGLQSTGDTEYFIRTLDDRPPDVRILRPAGDKQVTPLEEVQIEARADDDYGIQSFDLVFQSAGGKEKVVPFRGARGGLTASGLHTMFIEDLGLQPGDFVTYFARARDVARGRRSTEARSDIFFLEVKPFEEEFVAAQSQAMGGGGGAGDRGLQGLIEAQKEIIIATWKLDARARRARDAKPADDIRAVSKAQADLKKRAEDASGQLSRASGDPRRRLPGAPAPGSVNPIGRAIEAMGRAVGELEKLDTGLALPQEMEALNQLLKAEAENRRRQVARQQQAGGGGGGMNRSEADLSTLFDQELRKRNQTNYETPTTTEAREENKQDDPLEKIRELARRQDALNRQQRDLAQNRAQIEEEELKRQLERLTREQNQLRQEAEQLSRQMAQSSGQSSSQRQPSQGQQSGQSSGQGQSGESQQQGTRQLREISEEMRNAATEAGRQNPQQASARGERAAERLRDLERQLQGARPDDRRRALGDLQLESRQLADAERRLANEARRTAPGQAGQDARRRLAGEQDRLAQRADRLRDNVSRMAKSNQGDAAEQKATDEAARDLERQKIGDRMRQSADALRQPGDAGASQSDAARQAARAGDDIAKALDEVAQRLGTATGAKDADSRRLSDQLSKTQELREQVADLQRDIDRLQREGDAKQQAADARQQGQSGREGQTGQTQTPQKGQTGQPSPSQGAGQGSANGRDGSAGEQGASDGGRNGGLQQLQRDVNERMRDMNRLADEIRRDSGAQGPKTPEDWWRSFSAPGTEAFKQDFARWESLKRNLLVALERVESQLSDELRAHENKERLNAGGHQAVSEPYRPLVEQYYRSLAAPRKPQ